jgi:hypothetical protein
MEQYYFQVLNGEETIAAGRLAIQNARAIWPRLMELANGYSPGCRIRVNDQSGETIILVGVTTARRTLVLQ